jgi:hypothetical protein
MRFDGSLPVARLYRRLGYQDAGTELGSEGEVIVLPRRPVDQGTPIRSGGQ